MPKIQPDVSLGANATPLKEPGDFSIAADGPLGLLWRSARLSADALQFTRRRVLVTALFAWVPSVLLSVGQGHASPQPCARTEPSANINIPALKQTVLGLYVTAKEAYERWRAAPEKVMLLDVRTPEEFLFVGHAAMAWKVPVATQSYEWDPDRKQFPMRQLPDFVARVQQVAKPDDTLMVMCRSGGRSAIAVNLLAAAGFRNIYNIIDGMEGDVVDDPGSVFLGQHLKNGWKNSRCPWTYDLTPERMLLPKQQG